MLKKRTVLITGASSGIGYELAKVFGANEDDLILVARNSDRLADLKKTIEKLRSSKVYIINKDLSEPDAGETLFQEIKDLGLQVDILINNAGAGYVGLFHEKELAEDLKMMQLNMGTLTVLTKLFAAEMAKRRNGKILNVASTGSYHPGPFTAVYYATKAYVLSLTEALAIELKPYGVTVSALCPGATKTEFAKRAGKRDSSAAMDARDVARAAFSGLSKNKITIIPGLGNKLFVKLPRYLASCMIAKYQQGLSKERA